jgi:geranylgeranyl pyrophosphate synthase
MDDDTLRRGRLTTHVVFDEASAVLAGDGLLTDAFTLLADQSFFEFNPKVNLTDNQRLSLVKELSRSAGSFGMVRGQMLDVYSSNYDIKNERVLQDIQKFKTGALLGASCAMGAISASASLEDVEALRIFGTNIGVAFQIIDDCLDYSDNIGKTSGKDEKSGKLTSVSVVGRVDALERAKELTEVASRSIDRFGERAYELQTFANNLLSRKF